MVELRGPHVLLSRFCTSQASSGDNRLYWGIQLDQDLLETIVSIYPEWFKDCNMNMVLPGDVSDTEPSPVIPLVQVSEKASDVHDSNTTTTTTTSLQKAIDRNKESPKSPTAFHDQQQKLERAKMGDLLKSKIQKRPDKQSLIQQHILEDTHTDPCVQDKQIQLKKTCLVDGLNNKLSQRPGPLELVKGNILEADELLAQAVRNGSIPFRNTCETPSPLSKVSYEDESCSDGSSPSPPYSYNEHSQGSFPSLEVSEPSPVTLNHGSPCSARTSFSMSPPSSVCSPLSAMPSVVSPRPHTDHETLNTHPDHIVSGLLLHNKEISMRNRKKTKPKIHPKARTIKFHEYKGPPNAQKTSNLSSSSNCSNSSESSYDLLLQQQQLFLQWQLEWQQKYPQSVMPSTQLLNGDQAAQPNQSVNTTSNDTNQLIESPPSSQKMLMKLEDLKVSDLKAELKKRNLPVSGPKPILIERLKSHAESSHIVNKTVNSNGTTLCSKIPQVQPSVPISETASIGDIALDTLTAIPTHSNVELTSVDMDTGLSNALPNDEVSNLLDSFENDHQQDRASSPTPMDIEKSMVNINVENVSLPESASTVALSNDDIVQLQQRCIEKLQRELQKSQLQLQQTMISQQQQSSLDIETDSEENNLAVSSVPVILTAIPNSMKPIQVPVTSSQNPAPVAPAVSAANLKTDADVKLSQRQLIHQQLQQKIHQQNFQMHQQKLKKEQEMKAAAKPNTNCTLAALLESQPISNPPVGLTLPAMNEALDTSTTTNSFPTKLLATQIHETFQEPENSYPGTVPLFTDPSNLSLLSNSEGPKPAVTQPVTQSTISNGRVPAHRTSSLPSFLALTNKKPSPVRSNTDPQFVTTRPPPDYDEATRQLSKLKQQFSQVQHCNDATRLWKKYKSSVKCQAVDDVLEILIKNGELPPSAAQEPPSLASATVPAKAELKPSPSSLFYASSTTDSSMAITIPSNVLTSTVPSTAPLISSSCESDNSANLHITSLQSVLDMTPPSSAGFGESSIHTPSSLDFEFHLDVEDIEVMELEGLSGQEHQFTENSQLDVAFVEHLSKEDRRHSASSHTSGTIVDSSDQLQNDLMEFQGVPRGIDGDVMEWLEFLGENSSVSTNSIANFHHSTYGVRSEHDPLLSNVISHQDSLELFSVDDMDFKPTEPGILSWDRADFAT